MKIESWYDRFMDTLFARHPKKAQLAEALMDLLHVEREAIYRRLRKDVSFSIQEMAIILASWNISFDNILHISSGKTPFLMQTVDYLSPTKEEQKLLQDIIQSISSLKDFSDTELMDVCNQLPRHLYAGFEYLNQFYQFKWRYQYGSDEMALPLSSFVISEEMYQLTEKYIQSIQHVPQTVFLFDRMIFQNLVFEIQYFHSIQLINNEEKELLKKDLVDFLAYLSRIANAGAYPETRKKVSIYISQLNIDANYSYICSYPANICFIHVFDKYDIYSSHPDMVENFRVWMKLRKRTSIHLSGLDEKSKFEFFKKQHQIVDML